jgi:ADP-heptose:LPS heptosyltransferase
MKNKEWFQDRLQSVCDRLATDFRIIQIGAVSYPKLDGVVDMRGKTTIRQSAALLANAKAFIGLEGFLMHLARAVDCRSVIIYGGRIAPWQIGYIANENLYSAVECSPCWLRNRCDHDRKCMDQITVEQVLAAVRRQIQKHGTPLEVETANL